jgi:hypothetical protein
MKKASGADHIVVGMVLGLFLAMLVFALFWPEAAVPSPAAVQAPAVHQAAAACPVCQRPKPALPPACPPGISPALVLDVVKGCRDGTLDVSEDNIAVLRRRE